MMQLCLTSSPGVKSASLALRCRCQDKKLHSTVESVAIRTPKISQFCPLSTSGPESVLRTSLAAVLLPVAAACTVLTAYPFPVEAGILSGSGGLESLDLPTIPEPNFLKKIQDLTRMGMKPEENRKKYADFDAKFKSSPYVQGLLKKSRENAELHRKEIEDKYCERGAEWGVGDCSLNGLPQADKDAFMEALRSRKNK